MTLNLCYIPLYFLHSGKLSLTALVICLGSGADAIEVALLFLYLETPRLSLPPVA